MKKKNNKQWKKHVTKQKKGKGNGKQNGMPLRDIKGMPNFEKMREQENEARGLPRDFHRRRFKGK